MSTGPSKTTAVLASLCALLGALVAWLALRSDGPAGTPPSGPRADDPGRAAVIAALVAAGTGVYDSHPDPDVARVLQPGLEAREALRATVSSNAVGMRERDYALPKPAGLVRVVLLGDSFVFGLGVEAEERCGVVLEELLRERCGVQPAPVIEVLHLGVTSWSIVAEAAFLRRQLGLLQPDLVIHHVVPNDLDDTNGVRGFGAPGQLVPRRPQVGDAVVQQTFGRWRLHPRAQVLLPWGVDGESRLRLQEAAEHLARLGDAVRAAGGRYLLLVNWHAYQAVAAEHLAPALPAAEVAWLSGDFYRNARFRIADDDEHWNPEGHAQVARLLYGLITTRGLLPGLALERDRIAALSARQVDEAGREDAQRLAGRAEELLARLVGPAIAFPDPGPESAGQVYGGVDKAGLVSPYASLVLARQGGGSLHLQGRCLARPELDGATLSVFVDELPWARIPLTAGTAVDLRQPLPPEAGQRPFLAVRLACDDFVYAGDDLRQTVCFQLERVAIGP